MTDAFDRLAAALTDRYRIERQLGEGGMATVYLAEDLKHQRQVAIKVLKPELAAVLGAERFIQEITTTAQLQHPNILPLFDSGTAEGFLYYVMPYIEGETLRARLDRETQLGVDESVKLVSEVADALQYAHEQGVVHRDIKPENILLHAGRPMVADFGIALAVSAAAGGRMTETGLSLGTPHYMSPEQATAEKVITARSDVYSLGSVLYEMLTGQPPHLGGSAQQIIVKIIADPARPVAELRKSVPPNVAAAVAVALEKLPADRFQSAKEFARVLADPTFRYESAERGPSTTRAGPWTRLTVSFAASTALLAGALVWMLLRPAPQSPAPSEQRFRLEMPPWGFPAVLPDGSGVVYGAGPLMLRRWQSFTPTPIPGTEAISGTDPSTPVVSPAGDEVAFFLAGELKVAPLAGGVVRTLTDSARCCARWGPDGFIYYSATAGNVDRVPAAGGAVERVTTTEPGVVEGDFQLLPGGKVAVFTRQAGAEWTIQAVRMSTGEQKTLTSGARPYITPTGHLVYYSQGQILATPFNAETLELGRPVRLADSVSTNTNSYPLYSLSKNGTLVYYAGDVAWNWEFTWVSRSGEATVVGNRKTFHRGYPNEGWRLSPDGHRVAFGREVDGNSDVWVMDLPDGSMSRLTFSDSMDFAPQWSPDGRSIGFASARSLNADSPGGGRFSFWSRAANGTGRAEPVYQGAASVALGIWSPDGEWLVLRGSAYAVEGVGNRDIMALEVGVDSVAKPLIATRQFVEQAPAISRDGRWLAYTSNQTGEEEVFVCPFPNVHDGTWQISDAGGMQPVWAHNGRELFFVDPHTRDVEVAEFTATDGAFHRGRVSRLFTVPSDFFFVPDGNMQFYDVGPEDERFLMARMARERGDKQGASSFVLVENVFEELKTRMPN